MLAFGQHHAAHMQDFIRYAVHESQTLSRAGVRPDPLPRPAGTCVIVHGVSTRAAVAAGNADTAAAAVEVLRAGGNAFDAVLAAGFAAAVTEPGLSSLGGGGFLLARTAAGAETVFDFFVDSPGRAAGRPPTESHFTPVTVCFAGADQVFHAGWGSVAVPGCLTGYLHVHRRLGRLELPAVIAPARRLADRGTVLDSVQADVLSLLAGIVTLSATGRTLFAPGGTLLRAGDRLRNPELAEFLDRIAAGQVHDFADPALAGPLEAAMAVGGGRVRAADLTAYAVVEREPLRCAHRGAAISTNPAPSFGGAIVCAALAALGHGPALDASPDSVERLATALVAMSDGHPVSAAAPAPAGTAAAAAPPPSAVRGTTQVSVTDAEGNVASMTTSNGSCAGVFVPGTGVQLNNVMGEADLHPDGFHATPPGVRISSMMAPSVLTTPAGDVVALGSGGSERIRSALTCVLVALLDRGLALDSAVREPRLHWDRSTLQVEPGLPPAAVARLARWPTHVWRGQDLYFGGVHAVVRTADGSVRAVGDFRRGGAASVVDL
jgi:gamma-glutamyltranspeptidase/glutathione hydrolase